MSISCYGAGFSGRRESSHEKPAMKSTVCSKACSVFGPLIPDMPSGFKHGDFYSAKNRPPRLILP
jgi:hypothetical protein